MHRITVDSVTLKPQLSYRVYNSRLGEGLLHTISSVAGVYAPALVERFSGHRPVRHDPFSQVSPGFTPRPWLSVPHEQQLNCVDQMPGVAGVYAPALVERGDSGDGKRQEAIPCVAGVYAPALVERSAAGKSARPERSQNSCRRGLRPGLG